MHAGAGGEGRGDMAGALVTEGWIQLGTMDTNTTSGLCAMGLRMSGSCVSGIAHHAINIWILLNPQNLRTLFSSSSLTLCAKLSESPPNQTEWPVFTLEKSHKYPGPGCENLVVFEWR